jgi:aminopeptidase-like protein
LNEDKVHNIKQGLVATCMGDPGKLAYKKTRRGDAEIDKAVIHVLKHSGEDFEIMEFFLIATMNLSIALQVSTSLLVLSR